jgi:hypothetical protein
VVGADGERLEVVLEPRREIDPLAAWPVLEQRLTDAELAGCLSVSVKAIEDAVAVKAEKRKGAAAKRELAAALEAAQALHVKHVAKLITRRGTAAKE